VLTADSDNNANRGYNNDNNNIIKFHTSKSVTSGYAATNSWCIFRTYKYPTITFYSIGAFSQYIDKVYELMRPYKID